MDNEQGSPAGKTLSSPILSTLTVPAQLVKEGDEEKKSVAEFYPHRRHFFVLRMSKHARLEVKPQPEVTEALERLIGESFRTVEATCVF